MSKIFDQPLLRYALAIGGPISAAGVQFILAYVLLHTVDAFSFGVFSFYQLVIQLTLGISSALYCAPLAHDFNQEAGYDDLIYKTSALLFATLTSAILCASLSLSADPTSGIAVGLFAFFAHLRWFARALAYVELDWHKSFHSDLVFALSLASVGLWLVWDNHLSLSTTFAAYAFAAGVSLVPFGFGALLVDARSSRFHHLRDYSRVWKKYSRHALLGVITTEATSNAHAYMITLLSGASAYAPIAAAGLVIRPITLCANAITDIERPRIAQEVERSSEKLSHSLTTFRAILFAGWLASAGLLYLVACQRPNLIFGGYDFAMMIHASSIWLVISLFRSLARPESVLLQATGQFEILATANVFGGAVSVISCGLLFLVYGSVASLYGILLGDLTAALMTWSRGRAWQKLFLQQRVHRQPPS
ncbi:hypothetical protein IVB40_28240 [Bradyrhizobium sp. 40]|uniref:hypothetical protein n=1 Tax=Bradyrhizobium sp. 40 TaxID=2782674 RepID=UPI001FFE6E41|nr:hypothetical protein [Bradyrhizobium sp. 40]UPJ41143.1 hypothetical protein IVB40_28240 [Bradyrhizobium sp. 40]